MGYTIEAGMVEQNKRLLSRIDQAVRAGDTLRYPAPRHLLTKYQYQFHQLLKATQVLTDEAGGAFASLRDRTRISLDHKHGAVLFSPKASAATITAENAAPLDPNEEDMLELVRTNKKNNMLHLEFRPSPEFSIEKFETSLDMMGWGLAYNPETGEPAVLEMEDGRLGMVAERKEPVTKRSGFDFILEQYGNP